MPERLSVNSIFRFPNEPEASPERLAPPTAQEVSQLLPDATPAPRSSARPLMGWALLITGRILTISGALFLLLVVYRGALALPGVIACIGGLKLQLLGRRYKQRTAAFVLAKDIRDPVVYLRPFNADLQTTYFTEETSLWRLMFPRAGEHWKQALISPFRVFFTAVRLAVAGPRTEEEQLGDALKTIGPAIAVAPPAESLPPAGLPRLKLEPATAWQEQVSELLKRARLVVLRCGPGRNSDDGYWPIYRVGGGLGWEIAAVVKEVPPERLILLSPFNEPEYQDFLDRVSVIFPHGLPLWIESRPVTGTVQSLIWFDKDWNSKIAPLTWLDTTWRLDTPYPFAKSLKEKLQSILQTKTTPWTNFSVAMKRVFATALDCTLVISVISLPFIFASKEPLQDLGNKIQQSFVPAILLFCGTFFCYELLLDTSAQMATFGKRLVGLLVVDSSKNRLSFAASLKRSFFKVILFPVTWVTMFSGPQLPLHDRLAKTVVTNRFIRESEPSRFPFMGLGWLVSVAFALVVWISVVSLPRVVQLSAISFPKGVHSVTLEVNEMNGMLLLPVEINGQRFLFLLGTIAAETQLDAKAAARLNLKTKSISFSGALPQNLDVTDSANLGFGNVKLRVPRMVVTDLAPMSSSIGESFDGIIGSRLLDSAVVVADYPAKRVTLVEADSFKYAGGEESLPLSINQGWAFLDANVEVQGFPPSQSDYLIATELNRVAIVENLDSLFGQTSDPAVTTGECKSIKVGNLSVENFGPASCLLNDSFHPAIGAGFLKRFIVTFDYPDKRLILELPHN